MSCGLFSAHLSLILNRNNTLVTITTPLSGGFSVRRPQAKRPRFGPLTSQTPQGFPELAYTHQGDHPDMTRREAIHQSFPLSLTVDPGGPGSWKHSFTEPSEDNNPMPGEFAYLPGKTSGGSVPLDLPPALLAEDYTREVEACHP